MLVLVLIDVVKRCSPCFVTAGSSEDWSCILYGLAVLERIECET